MAVSQLSARDAAAPAQSNRIHARVQITGGTGQAYLSDLIRTACEAAGLTMGQKDGNGFCLVYGLAEPVCVTPADDSK